MKLSIELSGDETPAQIQKAHVLIDAFASGRSARARRRRPQSAASIRPTAQESASVADTDRQAARELVRERGLSS